LSKQALLLAERPRHLGEALGDLAPGLRAGGEGGLVGDGGVGQRGGVDVAKMKLLAVKVEAKPGEGEHRVLVELVVGVGGGERVELGDGALVGSGGGVEGVQGAVAQRAVRHPQGGGVFWVLLGHPEEKGVAEL